MYTKPEWTSCENCGRAVYQNPKGKYKRFCSDQCRWTYWNNHKQEPYTQPAKAKREEALRLRESGMSYKRISNMLGLSYNTVKCWNRRYGTVPPRMGIRHGVRVWNNRIKTIEDWLETLRMNVRDFRCAVSETITYGRPVNMVCGTTSANKGVDMLGTIISGKLRMDPFCGEIFAFCGKGRDKIKFIRWDGGGFQVVSRRREYGRYFWPPPKLGQMVTVSALEFEYILRGCEGHQMNQC